MNDIQDSIIIDSALPGSVQATLRAETDALRSDAAGHPASLPGKLTPEHAPA